MDELEKHKKINEICDEIRECCEDINRIYKIARPMYKKLLDTDAIISTAVVKTTEVEKKGIDKCVEAIENLGTK